MGGRRAPACAVRVRTARGRRLASSSPRGPSPGMPGIGFTHVTDPRARRRRRGRAGRTRRRGRRRAPCVRPHAPRARADRRGRVRRARPPRHQAAAGGDTYRAHPHARALHRSRPDRRVGPLVRRRARARHAVVRRVLGDVALAPSVTPLAVGPNHLTLYDVATPDDRRGGGPLGRDARRGGRGRPQARVPHRCAHGHAAPHRSSRRRRRRPATGEQL